MIHTRLGGLEINEQEWMILIAPIVKKYNITKHSTIGMSPNQAKQGNNNIEVLLNIHNKASFNRKNPPLRVSSQVRTYVKPGSSRKGYASKWSKDLYKVIAITDDGKQYMVSNNSRRLYSKHELLSIRGAEGKEG
jgi:hypothetical protein